MTIYGCQQVSCVLNVLHGGTKQGKGYAAAYARTSFTYARYSTLRRPYADKFEHVTTVSPYGQQLLHARIEVVIGKIKQWTMKTWKKRKKMMKKYHQQKLAEHEADDVFRQHPCWEHGHNWRVSLPGIVWAKACWNSCVPCLLACKLSGKFSHISGLRADGFPCTRLVIISTAPNFSIYRRCKLRNSAESEGFSHRSAQVTKRSDELTTLTTNTGQARQDRLTSGEGLVQQEVGFI